MIKGTKGKYQGIVTEATFYEPHKSVQGYTMVYGKIILNTGISIEGAFYQESANFIKIGKGYRFDESTNIYNADKKLHSYGINEIRVKK
jgi:hypothetical protein